MRVAMGVLAVLAILAGLLQIPHVTHVVGDFLHPAFHDSELLELTEASTSTALLGMALGTLAALAGIALAAQLWIRTPTAPAAIQARLSPLHTLFSRLYFMNELIDLLFVRPARWAGAVLDRHAEPAITQAAVVGAPSGIVRIASTIVRGAQTGSVRIYAAVLTTGVGALLLYVLVKR